LALAVYEVRVQSGDGFAVRDLRGDEGVAGVEPRGSRGSVLVESAGGVGGFCEFGLRGGFRGISGMEFAFEGKDFGMAVVEDRDFVSVVELDLFGGVGNS
jgi:hypothetical protein